MLTLAVVVGVGVVIASGGNDTNQVNGEDIPAAAHIQVNSGFLHGVTPDGTNPPTSGNHNPEQLADGAYSEMPAPWYFVHSLEHGRIEIQYSPDLSEQDQLALKGVFDESPPGMLFFPNDEMPYDVAVTAWTQLMGCKEYKGRATLDAIRDFRDTYRGLGPEPLPIQTG